jgi:hypothetical protein
VAGRARQRRGAKDALAGAHQLNRSRSAPGVAGSGGCELAIFAGRAQLRRPRRYIWLRFPAGSRRLPCRSPIPAPRRHCRRRRRRRLRHNEARLAAPPVRAVPPAREVPEDPLALQHPPRLWRRARRALPAPRARLAHPRAPAVLILLAARQARPAPLALGRQWARANPPRPGGRSDRPVLASPRNSRSTGPRRIVRR